MAKLQHANIGSDGPSILRLDPRGVGIHHAVAVRDYIEKMADRRVAQPIDMKRWRLRKSALDHHAGSAARAVVTFGPDCLETFATTTHHVAGQLYRQLSHINSIRLPRIKRCILTSIAADNGWRRWWPGIGSVGEKFAFRKSLGYRLMHRVRTRRAKLT